MGAIKTVFGLLVLVLAFQSAWAAKKTPHIVVSVKPVHSLVAGLMQGLDKPVLLIDGDTDPWAFSPDRGDADAIAKADVMIWVGKELEQGLAALAAKRDSNKLTLELLADDHLKVLPARADDNLRDPLFWLDSRNMLILLDALSGLLTEADPGNAEVYERNRMAMMRSIAAIDREMEFAYRDVSGVPVFAYHDTQQYFEQAYAMNVAATATTPGIVADDTARLLRLRSDMVARGDACLLIESGLDAPHLELLTNGAQATLVELDSFGGGLEPGPDMYLTLMRQNFERIAACVERFKAPTSDEQKVIVDGSDVNLFPEEVTPRYLLIDQFGRTVTNADFRGQLQLIFFGYTYCPDICPTSLALMSQALKHMGDEANEIQPIFITVDPKRDTREVLGEYVKYFHPRMLGLSSSPEVTKRTAELFKARYEKVPSDDGDPNRYLVDHTASVYVLGRNGEFITKFAHGMPPTEMIARLREFLVN